MLLRFCDGPGCHAEQDVRPGDQHPFESDPPWLTVVWRAVRDDPLHFCGRECANHYTAPPIEGVDDTGKLVYREDPRDWKRKPPSPAVPWDPKTDPPFGPVTPGEPAPV